MFEIQNKVHYIQKVIVEILGYHVLVNDDDKNKEV